VGWFNDLFFVGDEAQRQELYIRDQDSRTRDLMAGKEVAEDTRLQSPEGRAEIIRELRAESPGAELEPGTVGAALAGDGIRTRAERAAAGEVLEEDIRLQSPEGRGQIIREQRIETSEYAQELEDNRLRIAAKSAAAFVDEIRERSGRAAGWILDQGEPEQQKKIVNTSLLIGGAVAAVALLVILRR